MLCDSSDLSNVHTHALPKFSNTSLLSLFSFACGAKGMAQAPLHTLLVGSFLYICRPVVTGCVGPEMKPSLAETWAAMEDCVAKGLTRSIGVSNVSRVKLQALLDSPSTKIKPAVLQVRVGHAAEHSATELPFQNCSHVCLVSAFTACSSVCSVGQLGVLAQWAQQGVNMVWHMPCRYLCYMCRNDWEG